ncbi:molybdopterin-binding domain-containing protein [Sandaracinobacteroides hominis]|uniref:molybdopterin biosynthesis enzyme n=1 Tax=Sandaracinobacteroides hominis TaxID=2780086 RepID=UPI0018F5A829|nr:molybdopterin biosynthesis enzyme [Sandaracinobacteroides hominis]
MIFAELPLSETRGAILAHAIDLGGKRWPKGTEIGEALLAAAVAQSVTHLWVARLESGDVPEDEAAARIAAQLAGPGLQARAPANGRVNLHATADGLLLLHPDSIAAANRQGDAIGISTRPPLTPVRAGDLLATVKIIPYAVPATLLAAITPTPIEVRGWRPGLAATLVQTHRPGTPEKLLAKTAEVTAARLQQLGVALQQQPTVFHAVQPLAQALASSSAPLRLVAGATATSDARDVIPAAIISAGGEVLRVGMPVDPGNLLVLGRIGEALVIGLPGCARSPRRNGLDLILERWAAGLEADAADIAAMGVGGLLEEGGRPVPWGWSP